MKILFYVQTASDYGPDTVYDGLCRVIGNDNVLEYPDKPTYHSKKGGKWAYYPCLFDYPIVRTDKEKLEMLKNDEFDCIIVACRIDVERHRDQYWKERFEGDFYELLKEKSKTIPTYLLDQGDLGGRHERLFRDLNCRLYFKREYFASDTGMIPLNYCYSEKYIPNDIDPERTIPLFWSGSFNSYRLPFLQACGAIKQFFPQDSYRKQLLKANIGLCLRGFGFDTVRYYETPAHGALLFAQKLPIVIENDFTDGETAVFFETPEELKDKLEYLLKNEEYVDKIRYAGHEWLKKYHTSTIRASQLLERINGNSKHTN